MSYASFNQEIDKCNNIQNKTNEINARLLPIIGKVEALADTVNRSYNINEQSPVISNNILFIKNKIEEITGYLANNIPASVSATITHNNNLIEQQRAAEAAAAHAAAQAAAQAAANRRNR